MALVGPGQNAIIQEIAQKKLKRAPPPRAPDPPRNENDTAETNSFQSILRSTGKRGSLIRENNFQNESKVASEENELAAIFKRRRAASEKEDEPEKVQDDIPPWKRELMNRKQKQKEKQEESYSEEKENGMKSNSDLNNHKELVYPFKDGPPLQPLPSLLRAGKEPKKPPISNVDVKSLIDKYKNCIVVAPKNCLPVPEEEEKDSSTADQNGEKDKFLSARKQVFEQEDYDDVTDVATEAKKRLEEVKPQAAADFEQEDYDDVGVVKKVIQEEQETYDDVSAAGSANNESNALPSGDGEEFGDDVYEPVKGVVSVTDDTNKQEEEAQDEYELLPGEMEQQQPQPSNNNNINNSNSSKKNTLPKADQKKLKKEQEELKKKQREESKRLEKEKKKQEEEKKKREKVNTDLKKKHKLKGEGVSVGNGLVKDNWKGSGKHDLSLQKDESVFIISRKEGCPSGKYLVRNEAGNLGYVSADMIQEYEEEDEYAEIDSKLLNNVRAKQNNLPPPSTLPPSLPVQRPTPADQEQETYDDVKAGEDEELYEPI